MKGDHVAEASPIYLESCHSRESGNSVPIGFKQTEIGVIPEDWRLSTVGSEFQMQLGKMLDENNNRGELKPLLGNRSVHWGSVDATDLGYVKLSPEELPKYRLILGDILVCEGGDVGRCAIWDDQISECYFQKALHRLRPKDGYNSTLFLNVMQWLVQREMLVNYVTQTSIAHLPKDKFALVKIPCPPKIEQTAIANALSDVDALINELEKLIAKKQSIKTATMQQLLTGRTRLPQFALRDDGSPKGYKQSELGEVPEDWDVLAMGDLGSTYGGLSGKSKQDFGHGNSLYVPFTNVMANVVVDVNNLEKVDVREAQNKLALGDLLLNGSSETPEEVCFAALVSGDIRNLYLNSFCFGFRSNQKNGYLPLYLAYWFRSEVGRASVSIMAQGSTRYNISKSQFMRLRIVLPHKKEQTAIATILSDMDAEIQALEQRLGKTRQIKQGMMQELLTGRTRLI